MTDRLSEAEIEELRRLEREATPGPWRVDAPGCVSNMTSTRTLAIPGGGFSPSQDDEDDANFIAAARNALPRLLAERDELRTENNALTVHLAARTTSLRNAEETMGLSRARAEKAERELDRLSAVVAYRAANADPHCDVPHEDMAELIDRTVMENNRIRRELAEARRLFLCVQNEVSISSGLEDEIRAFLAPKEEPRG